MLYKKIIFSAAFFCVTVSAMADQQPQFNHYQGQYINFNAGAAFANKIAQQSQLRSGFLGAAVNAFLGTTLNPYFGAEIGSGYYSFGSNGGASITSINIRFTAPIGSRFSLFAKLG